MKLILEEKDIKHLIATSMASNTMFNLDGKTVDVDLEVDDEGYTTAAIDISDVASVATTEPKERVIHRRKRRTSKVSTKTPEDTAETEVKADAVTAEEPPFEVVTPDKEGEELTATVVEDEAVVTPTPVEEDKPKSKSLFG